MWIWTFGALNVAIVIASFAAGHAVGGEWVDSLPVTAVIMGPVAALIGALFLLESREATRRLPHGVPINGYEVPRWVIAASLWFAGVGIAPAIIALSVSGPPTLWHSHLAVVYPLLWLFANKALAIIAPKAKIAG